MKNGIERGVKMKQGNEKLINKVLNNVKIQTIINEHQTFRFNPESSRLFQVTHDWKVQYIQASRVGIDEWKESNLYRSVNILRKAMYEHIDTLCY